ncbi:MAG: NAD(P)-binding protein [Clostridiales bacterium]|nr:NAD(P)-binding protein [Clostridiales bacterium]
MIRIVQLKLSPPHNMESKEFMESNRFMEDLENSVIKTLKISKEQLLNTKIVKRSIDARKKNDIKIIYTIDAEIVNEKKVFKALHNNPNILIAKDVVYKFPTHGSTSLNHRPIIIGAGPAGLYCGLILAENGYKPILLERGEDVDSRAKSVEDFWTNNKLDINSNVQFGEGGAGTFSDGKLNTLVKDNFGRSKKVLEVFVEAGAPSEILYINKPHIGTDLLREVVKNIRKKIISLGGEVRFNSQVTDFKIKDKKLVGIIINQKEELPCEVAILAIGHSARDTFETLYKRQIQMEAKSFAMGVRIEHPQVLINKAQYGVEESLYLPVAEYKLSHTSENGRSVYSFCMCPGGYVVNSSSEEKRLAVNGMSYHDRDNENANSALIVSVTPNDYETSHPLGGLEFQRQLESAAYELGNGKVPIQLYKDFCENIKSKKLGKVNPQIKGDYVLSNLREVLPDFISQSLMEGIKVFGTKIKGFDREDAVLSGIESRTSSPVRILRNEYFENEVKGIYPCGEGAGYAGGITSAAMDGIKMAEAIAKRYAP